MAKTKIQELWSWPFKRLLEQNTGRRAKGGLDNGNPANDLDVHCQGSLREKGRQSGSVFWSECELYECFGEAFRRRTNVR